MLYTDIGSNNCHNLVSDNLALQTIPLPSSLPLSPEPLPPFMPCRAAPYRPRLGRAVSPGERRRPAATRFVFGRPTGRPISRASSIHYRGVHGRPPPPAPPSAWSVHRAQIARACGRPAAAAAVELPCRAGGKPRPLLLLLLLLLSRGTWKQSRAVLGKRDVGEVQRQRWASRCHRRNSAPILIRPRLIPCPLGWRDKTGALSAGKLRD